MPASCASVLGIFISFLGMLAQQSWGVVGDNLLPYDLGNVLALFVLFSLFCWMLFLFG